MRQIGEGRGSRQLHTCHLCCPCSINTWSKELLAFGMRTAGFHCPMKIKHRGIAYDTLATKSAKLQHDCVEYSLLE